MQTKPNQIAPLALAYVIDSAVGFLQYEEGGKTTTTTLPELATRFPSRAAAADIANRIPAPVEIKLYDPKTRTAH